MKNLSSPVLIIFLLLNFLLWNCGGTSPSDSEGQAFDPSGTQTFGTETGNPDEEFDLELTVSGKILLEICHKLTTECFSEITQSECIHEMLATDTIDEEIGIARQAYVSFQNIFLAEEAGFLQPKPEPSDLCLQDLSSTTCEEILDLEAYDPADPYALSMTENMIPKGDDSCPKVFSPSVE